jgi:hypothetical protein
MSGMKRSKGGGGWGDKWQKVQKKTSVARQYFSKNLKVGWLVPEPTVQRPWGRNRCICLHYFWAHTCRLEGRVGCLDTSWHVSNDWLGVFICLGGHLFKGCCVQAAWGGGVCHAGLLCTLSPRTDSYPTDHRCPGQGPQHTQPCRLDSLAWLRGCAGSHPGPHPHPPSRQMRNLRSFLVI